MSRNKAKGSTEKLKRIVLSSQQQIFNQTACEENPFQGSASSLLEGGNKLVIASAV